MKGKKEVIEGFSITKRGSFKVPRKIGIDSSCLIDLITSPELFSYQHARIFGMKGLFFTHSHCFREVRDYLIEKEGYHEKEAQQKVRGFLKEHNIKIIKKDFTRQDVLTRVYENCKKAKIPIHKPDSFIIADFIKKGINKAFSTNNHFRDACNACGIDGSPFPSFDKELNRRIKKAIIGDRRAKSGKKSKSRSKSGRR